MSLLTHRRIRRAAIAAAAGAAVIGLSACGSSGTATQSPTAAGSSSSSAADPAGHNAQDISFAQMMIPHHQQAIEMAKLVPSRTQNQKVRALASQIEAAQDPEIATMRTWLQQWGATASPSASGHDAHGGDGMMTAQQMAELEKASGAAFDRLWLQMMITHHEGAVTMAQQELATGQNGQAKAMAQAIIGGQTKEINEMKQLLGTTPSASASSHMSGH
jgi:uncharacterized protein (DUF305 family)